MRLTERNGQRGAARTVWLVLGAVTCVVAGTTFSRCLTCGEPEGGRTGLDAGALVRGAPLNPQSSRIDEPEQAEPQTADRPPTVTEALEASALENPAPTPAVVPEPPRPSRTLPSLKQAQETPAAPEAAAAAKAGGTGPLELSFEDLASYEYKFPEIGAPQSDEDQIPERIHKLSGKRIAIPGFMIPVKTEGDAVVEFVLVRNQMWCCYGVMPKMNEWIHVVMEPGKEAPYSVDIPLTCTGTLEVGEVWENGMLMSIYRLACTHVEEPPLRR